MSRRPKDFNRGTMKGRVRLAVATTLAFNAMCGVVSYLAVLFLGLERYYSIIVGLLLFTPMMLLLGRWLYTEIRRPLDRAAGFVQSLERNPSAALPRTTGAAETDDLLQLLLRVGRLLHENGGGGGADPVGSGAAPAKSSPSPDRMVPKPPGACSSLRHAQDATLKLEFAANAVRERLEQLYHRTFAHNLNLSRAASSIPEIANLLREAAARAEAAAAFEERFVPTIHSARVADSARRSAINGIRGTVHETAKRIKHLGERTQEIGQIVSQFEALAEDTNLVALNASLRTGTATPEFAAVAHEVKRLAERSGRLTQQISELSRSVTAQAAEAAASMEETIRQVVVGSTPAADAGLRAVELESLSTDLAGLVRDAAEVLAVNSTTLEQIGRDIKLASEDAFAVQTESKHLPDSIEKVVEAAAHVRDFMSSIAVFSATADTPNNGTTESEFIN